MLPYRYYRLLLKPPCLSCPPVWSIPRPCTVPGTGKREKDWSCVSLANGVREEGRKGSQCERAEAPRQMPLSSLPEAADRTHALKPIHPSPPSHVTQSIQDLLYDFIVPPTPTPAFGLEDNMKYDRTVLYYCSSKKLPCFRVLEVQSLSLALPHCLAEPLPSTCCVVQGRSLVRRHSL